MGTVILDNREVSTPPPCEYCIDTDVNSHVDETVMESQRHGGARERKQTKKQLSRDGGARTGALDD